MSFRIKFSKKAVCFMVMMALMLNGLSLTVFAGEKSKTVSYETAYTFTISYTQFPDYMNSPSSYVPATYYYNDGTYKGTLNLTYAACSAPTAVGNYLEVKIFTTYSGTVYADDESKTTTYDKTYTFVINPTQFPNYMNSPSSYVPATYYYDDGTYRGTLGLTYAACSVPTATGNPIGSQLEVKIFTTYSGTVFHK